MIFVPHIKELYLRYTTAPSVPQFSTENILPTYIASKPSSETPQNFHSSRPHYAAPEYPTLACASTLSFVAQQSSQPRVCAYPEQATEVLGSPRWGSVPSG